MKRGYSRTFAASLIATLMSVGLAGLARAQDTSAPTVGAITPATATINVSTAFSATYTDDVGVTSCNLWLDGADQGAMTLSGTTSGTATKSVTIATSGSHTLQAKCKDAENNEGTGASTSVTVSAATGTAPTVGAVTPTTSAADAVTTYSASYTDNAGVTSCALYVDGASQGTMTLSSPNGTSGTATKSHIFTAAGTKTLQVRCLDADDNEGLGAETTVTVTSGSNAGAPTVGAISPTAATVNTATTLSVTYSDTDNVSSCNLWIGGADQGAMTLSGATSGTATKSHTFTTTGALTAQAKCKDAANNEGMGALATITVSAAGGDTAAPSAPTALALSTNTCDGTPTLTWTASTDNVAVTGYELKLDSGAFLNIGNVTTWTASATLTDGSHTVTLRALDAAGNVSAVTTQTFSIDADAENCPEQQPTTCATGEVLICHVPPGNASAAHGICVGESAVQTHIDQHGDHAGACTGTETGSTEGPQGPKFKVRTFALEKLTADATLVHGNATRADHETKNGRGCEMAAAAAAEARTKVLGDITNADAKARAEAFIACGTETTLHLGARERLGIINSFRAAFKKLPDTLEEWQDIIKIGNGRFTVMTSTEAETAAKATFKLVYLRDPDMTVTADRNAVIIMAYGLRPSPRNMDAEREAIATFMDVFDKMPTTASDWDTVRAIAYSGATR